VTVLLDHAGFLFTQKGSHKKKTGKESLE